MDRLTLEDIEEAVEAPVPTEEIELIPGRPKATVRGLCSYAEYETFAKERAARLESKAQVLLGGKPVKLTVDLVNTALTLKYGVLEPKLTWPAAVKLCARYGLQCISVRRAIDRLSGANLEAQVEAAKDEIEQDPFPGDGDGAGLEAEAAAE